MFKCPKCNNEYQEGYKICSNCKEELIEIPDVTEEDTITNIYNMKKTLIGIALLISSTLAYVGISISATIYGSQLTEWYTDKGKIGTALTENALLLFPSIIAAIMFVIGIVILFRQYISGTDKENDTY